MEYVFSGRSKYHSWLKLSSLDKTNEQSNLQKGECPCARMMYTVHEMAYIGFFMHGCFMKICI